MLTIAETLKQFWLRQGIKLRRGATAAELGAFEVKYNIRLPEDLREYLATVDGFDSSEHLMTDSEVITFLGLDEIRPLSEYWPHVVADANNYFVFADYSLAAHVYAIRLDAAVGGNDVVVVYEQSVAVAGSFSEFIEGYLKSDIAVLFPDPVVP